MTDTSVRTIYFIVALFIGFSVATVLCNVWHDKYSTGLTVQGIHGDVERPIDGDLWYDLDRNTLRCREHGKTSDCKNSLIAEH